MSNNQQPDDDNDSLLFRQSMKNVQPLAKSQQRVVLKKSPVKRSAVATEETRLPYLSDHNEATVTPDEPLFFVRSGMSPKQIKKLKQGKIPILERLDLHGHDVESARNELLTFLSTAHHRDHRSLLIIHGKGHSNKPILKNKINSWLQQLDFVLAFCSAQPSHGGTGAVYVLLKKFTL